MHRLTERTRGAQMIKYSLLVMVVLSCCLYLAGCSRAGGGDKVILKQVSVDGADVSKALELPIFRFEVVRFVRDSVTVEFWVEEHLRSAEGPVTKTHELTRWSGERLAGDLLLMLPGEDNSRYCFAIGQSESYSDAPESMELECGTMLVRRVPQRIEGQLGEPLILAVEVCAPETTGANRENIQDYVEENLQLPQYERIRVYKARFSAVKRKPSAP